MTPEERTAVLDALVRLSKQDADLTPSLTTFLPLLKHRYALHRDAVVVLGGRGAGKTALFRLVNDARTAARLRDFFEDERIPEATWFDAFSQGSMHHPDVLPLEAHAASAADLSLRAFWMTHLLRRTHDEVPGLVVIPPVLEEALRAPVSDLAAWLPVAEANLGAVSAALDATERALVAADRSVVATYDNLDRIGQFDPVIRRRYLSTLLALWLSLASRYKKLRGKIFLRDDLFDAGELGFADAGKLRARAETIVWDAPSLYRVVVRHLAGASEAMRAWLREVPGLELRDRGEFGWMPGEMSDDVQYDFAGKLAWKVIGKGALKLQTHKWIVNRLEDANRRVTPRAMLWFFEFAGEAAQKRPGGRRKTPLGADDLVAALRRTSRERVEEVKEEYPVAVRLENLRGMTLPLDRAEATKRLGTPRLGEKEGIPARGDVVLEEMKRLGLLRESDKGLDVPDIYRYSFEIAPDYATAWADFLKEDSPSAREQFVRELPRLREILRASRPESLSKMATEEVERKDYGAARGKCERALELVRNAGDAHGEVEVLTRLGEISWQQAERERAREEYARAAEVARRARLKAAEADALWWAGWLDSSGGETDRALDEMSKSLALYHQIQNDDGIASCRLMLGVMNWERGRYEEASEHYKLALSTAQRGVGSSHWEINAFENLASLAEVIGNLPGALRLMILSTVVAMQRGDVVLARLRFERDGLAAKAGASSTVLEALTKTMSDAYVRDRGWGVVRETFPDKNISAPAE